MALSVILTAGTTVENSSIKATGFIKEALKQKDLDDLKLTQDKLRRASEEILGMKVLGVTVSDKVPNPAYKELAPNNAKILGIVAKPVTVKTQTFSNESSEPATFNVEITETLTNTATNTTTKTDSLQVGQKITYGIDFLGSGAKGETSFMYGHTWGSSSTHTQTVTVGSQSGVTVTLKPGETIIASLISSRGTLNAKIDYDTTIDGNLLAIIPSLPVITKIVSIKEIMKVLKMENPLKSSENLSVGYYSDSKIEIKNP